MGFAIKITNKDFFFFLTLATEEGRDNLLSCNITFEHENIKESLRCEKDANNLSGICISTMLVANNLPKRSLEL